MAITRDRQSTAAIVGSSLTCVTTFATQPTAGAKCLVMVQYEAAASMAVTDNAAGGSNTYVLDASRTTGGKKVWLYRADNIVLPSSGNLAVTITLGAAGTLGIVASTYLGVASGAAVTSVGASGTGTAASSGAITSSGLLYGGMSDASGANPSTITLGGAVFAAAGQNLNGSTGWPWQAVDAIVTGSQTASWTITSSAWSACLMTYAAAPEAARTTTNRSYNPARFRASSW